LSLRFQIRSHAVTRHLLLADILTIVWKIRASKAQLAQYAVLKNRNIQNVDCDWFRLPACLVRTPETVEVEVEVEVEVDALDPSPMVKGKRVLIVDDGKSAVDILAMFFRMEGMEVEVGSDGLQGFEKAVEFRPDLVLSWISACRMWTDGKRRG
jgi:hypothetical protein